MPRPARRYDFYLPLAFNNGRAIPEERFDVVEKQLLTRFGGVTSQHREFPLRGMWLDGHQLYHDQVIVMTALDFRPRGSAAFVSRLKTQLLRDFDQLAILITESPLRVY